MPKPYPEQIAGAEFLAARKTALLADEPRVGKTGASIMACDLVRAWRVLVITTATNRFNFARDFKEWQSLNRTIGVIVKAASVPQTSVVICPWSMVSNPTVFAALRARQWDVLIVDENHYAKNPEAGRSKSVYGRGGFYEKALRVWPLTGTPYPNSPLDIWVTLKAIAPTRLLPDEALGLTDVRSHRAFMDRYTYSRPMKVGYEWIDVVKGGKNEEELASRLRGWMLRRTQTDVGMRPPQYDLMLLPPSKIPKDALRDVDQARVLEAAELGNTTALDMHLGALRRLTGSLKAELVADAVLAEMECGTNKVVIMAWHHDTMDALKWRLRKHHVFSISGTTPNMTRQIEIDGFRAAPRAVFVGQIQTCGEAVDLSSADELIFAEPSFVPKDMKQASLRITNRTKNRNCRIRIATLSGSLDEAVNKILIRKVASITKVLENT